VTSAPDPSAAVARFQRLLRIPTVSLAAGEADDGRFEALAAAMAVSYPLLHEALTRETIAGHSLLYRWPGREPGDPLVLMAHLDVVPVVLQEWEHPPFEARIVGEGPEAELHGRGAIDDKGALAAILEAVEQLVGSGHAPARDVYLAFGHDEEVGGAGARAIVAALVARGVRPGLVLDEGGAVVEGVLPGLTRPAAVIGVAERGDIVVDLLVREAGGHASTPPRLPATARVARALERLRRRPWRPRLVPPVRAMLATLAPHVDGPLGLVLRHLGVTGPVVAVVLPLLGPETNALVRTTAAATRLSGAPGDNVLATTASATLSIRLLTGETAAAAVARVRRVVADDRVEVVLRRGGDPSPVSPWRGEAWARLARALHASHGPDVVPAPYLQLGASDARAYAGVSDHVYRFTPFALSRAERDALHAPDERIRLSAWLQGIRFYRALLEDS
jgi:carboxypeptidase PM20D1